jgi:hypothetical protein
LTLSQNVYNNVFEVKTVEQQFSFNVDIDEVTEYLRGLTDKYISREAIAALLMTMKGEQAYQEFLLPVIYHLYKDWNTPESSEEEVIEKTIPLVLVFQSMICEKHEVAVNREGNFVVEMDKGKYMRIA